MAKKFNRGIINLKQIEEALTMDSVLEHYRIKYEGRAICCPLPNHLEKTGSFFLYKNDKGKERFKCHGCGAQGNPLKLIIEMEEIGFHDAVKVAEEITGIEIIYSKAMKHVVQDNNMDKLMKWLYETHFRNSKHWITTETKSTPFVDYLKSRNIPKDVAYEYGLGFAEGSNNNFEGVYEDGLLDKAVELKVIPKRDTVEDARPLIDAGLLYNPKGTDDLVATLRNAVVFPVIVNTKIKGFIARNIDSNSTVRYIKTTNFGLWNSDYIEDGDDIILVEGCFDAVCLNMLGFNAYALLGTQAMTNEVKKVLLRASRIYILFDDESYKEKDGGTNSGGQGALDLAEELGYKAMICKPLGIKDINEALTKLYNTNCSTMDEEEAFEKAKEDLYERVLTVVYGKKVIGEDGEVVCDEDDESVREGGAESLIDRKLNEWLEITDEVKRIQALRSLLEVAYLQYDGDSAFLEILANKLKLHNIKGIYFKEVLGKVKKEVVLEKTISSTNESNALMVSSSGQDWVDWEVVDGVLYKNVPEFREDGSYPQEVVSITAPKIDCTFKNIATGENEIQISFRNKYGKHTEIITERKNIAQKYKIVDTLTNESFDIIDSTSADIVNYLKWYENNNLSNIKEKLLTNVTGYFDDETFIGRRGEIININGLISKENSIVAYKYVDEDLTSKEITEINFEKWKEITREVFPKLLLLNERKNSIGITSWFLSAPYKEHINKKNNKNEYSPLNVYGVQGSGKSSLTIILQQLLGGTSDVKLAGSKLYGIIVNMSSSNSYPLLLDEYKLEDIGETQNSNILRLVKGAFNNYMEQRGNGIKRQRDYKLQTPVCVIGEHMFTAESSDAVRDRSAIFELSKTWMEENQENTKDLIDEINKLDLNEFFGGYLVFILRTVKDGRFVEMYEKAEKRAYEFAKENKEMLSRNIKAITILAFGIEVLKELYKEVDLECDITDEDIEAVFNQSMQHIINSEIKETSLDKAMKYFTTFIFKYLNEDEKTLDSDKGLLYIQQSKFFDHLDREQKIGKADIPNKSGLMTYVRNNMKSKNGYVVEMNKAKTINGKTKKCIVFDIRKLDEITGIEVDEWIGTKQVEEDYYYDGITSIPHRSEEARDRSITYGVRKMVVKKLEDKLKIKLENVNTINLEKEIYKRVKKGFKEGNVVIDNLVSDMVLDLTKFWKDNEDKILENDSETMEAILENFKVS